MTHKKIAKTDTAKKLVISYNFSPFVDTSANVMAKRIREKNEVIDVIQNDMSNLRSVDDEIHILTDSLIENQIIIDSRAYFGSWPYIKDFYKKGMVEINNLVSKKGEYQEIYSRAMFPASHFLGFEYKIKYPNVKWIAEFSDPILHDTDGKVRETMLDDENYLNRVNNLISQRGFPKYHGNNVYFLSEYLPYVFADEIIFTNENQKEYMINAFPIKAIKSEVRKKSKIKIHPTLEKEFYHLIECDYKLDDNYVNIAYFGNFYGSRNLDDVFFALYGLNDDLKKKCMIHIFTSDVEGLKESLMCSPVLGNLKINPYVSFLEFLNLLTKFDCLILNDAKFVGEINPFLPSKLSDYIGSGTDTWTLSQEGSTIHKFDAKYKSSLGDLKSTMEALKQIIEDHSS